MIVGKSRITGKGQLQLPVKIRKTIGAEIGDELLFKQKDSGEIVVELVKKQKLSELAGALPVKNKFTDIETEEKETRQRVAEKVGTYAKRKK